MNKAIEDTNPYTHQNVRSNNLPYKLHNLLLVSTKSSDSSVVGLASIIGPAVGASFEIAPDAGPALSRIHFATSFANVILSSPGSACTIALVSHH